MTVNRRLASDVVQEAKQAGACSSEVYLVESHHRTWRVVGAGVRGEDEHKETAYVRVYLPDGRQGQSYGAISQRSGAGAAVKRAIAAAQKAEPAENSGPPQRLDVASRGLSISDPRQPRIDDDARREVITQNLEECASVKPGLRPDLLTYEEWVDRHAYASSRGHGSEEVSTRFRLMGEIRTATEGVIREQVETRHFADAASRPLGVDLARRVLEPVAAASLPSAPTALVLDPRVVAGLLPVILGGFSAELIERGASFVSTPGVRVASDGLHIYDDATIPGGLGTRGFDGRGVPPVPIPLIREGVASAFYRGADLARERDLRPSGHEAPGGGILFGNLVVRPGGRSRNMMFPDLGTFVLVEDVLDVAGVIVRSGEIRVPVRAHLYAEREVVGRLGILTLVTTAQDLLSAVTELGNDQVRHGLVDTPTWVVQGPWFE